MDMVIYSNTGNMSLSRHPNVALDYTISTSCVKVGA